MAANEMSLTFVFVLAVASVRFSVDRRLQSFLLNEEKYPHSPVTRPVPSPPVPSPSLIGSIIKSAVSFLLRSSRRTVVFVVIVIVALCHEYEGIGHSSAAVTGYASWQMEHSLSLSLSLSPFLS